MQPASAKKQRVASPERDAVKRPATPGDEPPGKRPAPAHGSITSVKNAAPKLRGPTKLPLMGGIKQPGNARGYHRQQAAARLPRHADPPREVPQRATVVDAEEGYVDPPPGTTHKLEVLCARMQHDLPVVFAADLPFATVKAATLHAGKLLIAAAEATMSKSVPGVYASALERIEMGVLVSDVGMADYFSTLQGDADRAGATVCMFGVFVLVAAV